MGGHNAGDFASRFAVKVISEYIRNSSESNPIRLIDEAVKMANRGLIDEALSHEELYGMGTTVVVTTVLDGFAYTANAGDSRLYLLDDGLRQITQDHSFVGELIRKGEITEEDARKHPDKNIITRALGQTPDLEVDFFDYRILPDGMILMCSDGLTNMVTNGDIEVILKSSRNMREKAGELIDTANENGGLDNIAVILIAQDEAEA